MRIAIIGNAGAGKSTLARRLGKDLSIDVYEVDRLLWRPGWQLVPEGEYIAAHDALTSLDTWILEGVGRRQSIADRLSRASHVVLIDLPLWQHFWLAAERHLAWERGELSTTPGGYNEMPPLKKLFETIWMVDQEWMPFIRDRADEAEHRGVDVYRLKSVEELDEFQIEM